MKLLTAICICILTTAMSAATVSRSDVYTTATNSATVSLLPVGKATHTITWTPVSASACSVKLQQSSDGSSWSDLIAGQTCTSSGSASTTGTVNYVRTNVTSLTGTSVTVTYSGVPISIAMDTLPVASRSVDLNSTADQAITIVLPAGATTYRIRDITLTNVSGTMTLVAGGVYTGTSKSGTAVVSAGQVYTALTSSTSTLGLTMASTDVRTEATLYFSLTTASGAAASADLYVIADVLK